MRREERYLVLKLDDIKGALSPREKEILIELEETINLYRKTVKSKPPVNCVIVEDGWPMYEQTWAMIEAWVDAEEAGRIPEKIVTLPQDEYALMIKDIEFLRALQAAGVDNWDGYSEAQELRKELNE